MKMAAIAPGERFIWRDRLVEIDLVLSPSRATARDEVTGRLVTVDIGELRSLPARQRATVDLTVISADDWNAAKRQHEVLGPFLEQGSLSAKDAEEAAKQLGRSSRQIRRYFKQMLRDPSLSGSVRSKAGRPRGSRHLLPEQEHAIEKILTTYFDVPEPQTVPQMMPAIRKACEEFGCPPPAQSTIYARIEQRETFVTYRKRKGKHAALQKFEPRGNKITVTRPLEYVQLDHTEVDAIVVSNDRFRAPLGRPWLSAVIDVFTRCILGIYLSLDAPSAVSVGSVIAHASLPKTTWLKARGFSGDEWPMYGRPEQVSTDNGKDLRSDALARGCNEHNIVLYHRPVGRPHWGGHIERFFRTLMLQTHSLPGTTFSNAKDRKARGYRSEDLASLTLDDLQDWLTHAICRYHSTIHRGLGKTPYAAWMEGRTIGGRYVPPALIASPKDFLLTFLPFELRRVNNYGIDLFGLTYWSDRLAPYIPRNEKKAVYYDPRDISRAWIRDPEGFWIELKPRGGPMAPISLAEHKALRKHLRQEANHTLASETCLAATVAQNTIVQQSKAERRKAHRTNEKETERVRRSGLALPRNDGAAFSSSPEDDMPIGPEDVEDSVEELSVEHWND